MTNSVLCNILMCTYNGAQFLEHQLQSLDGQTVSSLNIYVSDDGSSDETLAILRSWQGRWRKGSFSIFGGPRRGFAENFRSLINAVSCDGYVAFCDQDDVWHAKKLERAIAALVPHAHVPSLYGGRSILVDSEERPFGTSPLFTREPSFENALVQSLAAGNTMVLNAKGYQLLRDSALRTSFLMHDWWAYLLLTGAGGKVIYDPQPQIYYRQHGGNVLGGSLNIRGRIRRAGELWSGRFTGWSNVNIASLESCEDMLLESSRMVLADFKSIRQAPSLRALFLLRRSGIRRQSLMGDIALFVGAFVKRI